MVRHGKSKTEKVICGGKSAILPNCCCLLSITVLSTPPVVQINRWSFSTYSSKGAQNILTILNMKNGSQHIPNITTTDVIILMDFFFLAIKFSSLPSSLLPGIKDSKYKVQPLRLLSSPKSYMFFWALVWSRSSFSVLNYGICHI